MRPIDKIKRAQVPTYLEHYIPFNSGSTRGRLFGHREYVVYSYDTVICKVDKITDEVIYFDAAFYSNTTSFIQNLCKEIFITREVQSYE